MIPTKTYPLSAIIGDEVDNYERGYAQGCEEGRERIAELEAELTMRREKVKEKAKKWRWMFFYPAPIQPSSIYVSEPFTEDEAAKYFDGFTRQRVVPEWKMEVECDE